MAQESKIIFSLYPNTRGFGFTCVEMPQKLLDFGVITVKPVSNEKVLRRVKKYAHYFKPAIIILRDYPSAETKRGERISEVIREIEKLANELSLPVFRYSRQQTRDVFEQFGATSKYEISEKLLSWFPELSHRMPKIRKAWMDEDYNMGIFDSLALMTTHQYLT